MADKQKLTADGFPIYELPDCFKGYATIVGNTLWLSLIVSLEPGKGNFRRFLDKIEKEFKVVKVPTPSNRMYKILSKRGYVLRKEGSGEPYNEMMDVMIKEVIADEK